MIKKIVSGGQTGADHAEALVSHYVSGAETALDAAHPHDQGCFRLRTNFGNQPPSMKKKPIALLVGSSILLSLMPAAEARIGETKNECIARYGLVQPSGPFISISGLEEAVAAHTGETSKQEPDDFLSFRKAGFEIVVGFKEGRAVLMQYYPVDREQSVSKETLFSILQANGNGKKWIMYSTKMFPFSPSKPDEIEQVNSLVLWTEDGELRATCRPEDSRVIVVMKNGLLPRFEPRLTEKDKDMFRGLQSLPSIQSINPSNHEIANLFLQSYPSPPPSHGGKMWIGTSSEIYDMQTQRFLSNADAPSKVAFIHLNAIRLLKEQKLERTK